jgi:hypothetical protein
MQPSYFNLNDVPNKTLELISEELFTYTVAILEIVFDMPGLDTVKLLGSGTLVEVNGCRGLVTAQHVVSKISDSSWIGLTLKRTEDDYKIRRKDLKISYVEPHLGSESTPDLAFIMLKDEHAAQIGEEKRFCPLLDQRDQYTSNLPDTEYGPWVACGAISERTSLEDSVGDFAAVASVQLFCGFSGFDGEYLQNGFDYYEIEAGTSSTNSLPASYSGMSGGGLWQVPVKVDMEGAYTPSRYLLAGVVVRQTRISDQSMRIRSHGRRSLFEDLLNLIQSECA